MSPIQYLITLLTCAAVSGNSIRGIQARRTLRGDDARAFGSSMSYGYEDPAEGDDQELPLIGTSWTALKIGPTEEFIEPITLSFHSGRITGSTGCNRYRGEFELLSNEDGALSIKDNFSTTRMFCNGKMEQERNFITFLENGTVFYEIISNELIFYDYVPGIAGGSSRGEILARFEEDL